MLDIQKYLKDGNTLINLYQQYDIDYNVCDELGIVVFNYRNLSPLDQKLTREARALVLELNTWNVVSKSLDAFFEPSEVLGKEVLKKFDWASARALKKMDGALVTLYYYKGEWRLCTRFSADGSKTVWSVNAKQANLTWAEYAKMALVDMGTTWDDFTSKLDKDIFYSFEIVGPENRVFVIYDTRAMYLVGAVRRDTLKEIDIFTLDFPELKPPHFDVTSYQQAWGVVAQHPLPFLDEGFIAVDANFNRLKLRSQHYVDAVRTYSVTDEATALRELRKLDVHQFTVGTSGGSTTSTSSASKHSASVISLIQFGMMEEAPEGINKFDLNAFFARIADMARFVADQFKSNDAIADIWPDAVARMTDGANMSEILDSSSDDEILDALKKYEKFKEEQNS